MRAVSFIKRLQWDLPGTVFRHGITIGDVDNDGDNELVVGTAEGELYIFKGSELWQKIMGLGLVTSVAIGDIFNYGRNALVVICGDGWVHIFYSPRPVNPATASLNSMGLTPTFKDLSAQDQLNVVTVQASVDVGTGMSSMTSSMNSDQMDNNSESNELSGKMECVHVQRIPTNTKVVLLADVDRDGAIEMVLGLTDRVVRSYRWSSNVVLGSGRLIGLNKWECTDQIGTVTLQHMGDGTPTLLVAQPGGTFMRIKCHPEDCGLGDNESSETNSEAAASCVDYQTLGISRMRNPNISTEILGDLEPGTREYVSTLECDTPKYTTKSDLGKQSSLEDGQLCLKNFGPSSLEFRENYSQLEMRKSCLGEAGHFRKEEFLTQGHEQLRFYSSVGSTGVDQVDGNFMGGNVILGEFESEPEKKSLFPTYKDFSRDNNNSELKKEAGENIETKKVDEKSNGKAKPYALATLDGTIMLVQDEVILWAMQVDHQIFALCRLDVTGDGTDEIVACTWDGQTYILDQQRNSVRFQFEEPVKAFCTGQYSVTPGASSPCLVYNTFNDKIFLYYDVVLPNMVISSLNATEDLDDNEKRILDELLKKESNMDDPKKVQLLTEWLLYGAN